MLSPETKKFMKIFKSSSLQILKSAIPSQRRFKDVHEFTPFFTDRVRKITASLIGLCLLSVIAGCGSSSDSSDNTASASSASITEFSLNGSEGTIDEAENAIVVIMPSGTVVTNLVATFTTSTGASVMVDSTVQVTGMTDNNFTSPVVYTVTAADATTQDYTVTVIVAAKSIAAFFLDGVEGTINEVAKTIAVTMPTGTDVTALVATFTPSTGASVKVGSTVQVSGTTTNDFTSPVVYTVTAIDATTQVYTVTVVNEPAIKPAASITVKMTPNNTGTSVPAGVFCTKTPSITGSEVVKDKDGNIITTATIVRQWLDNGVTRGGDTSILVGPFAYGHTITYKATADGVPSNTVTANIA